MGVFQVFTYIIILTSILSNCNPGVCSFSWICDNFQLNSKKLGFRLHRKWSLNRQSQCKKYRAQTPQNLGLTKIVQKFRKTSTPLTISRISILTHCTFKSWSREGILVQLGVDLYVGQWHPLRPWVWTVNNVFHLLYTLQPPPVENKMSLSLILLFLVLFIAGSFRVSLFIDLGYPSDLRKCPDCLGGQSADLLISDVPNMPVFNCQTSQRHISCTLYHLQSRNHSVNLSSQYNRHPTATCSFELMVTGYILRRWNLLFFFVFWGH